MTVEFCLVKECWFHISCMQLIKKVKQINKCMNMANSALIAYISLNNRTYP